MAGHVGTHTINWGGAGRLRLFYGAAFFGERV